MHRINKLEDIAVGLQSLMDLDPRLQRVLDLAQPVPLRRFEPGFKSLASIVVGQQLSIASASAIWARLNAYIDPLTPENFMAAGEAVWRAAGLSRSKQVTLSALSVAISSNIIDLHALCDQSSEDALTQLIGLKGIGPWTAEVYLLFAAGHPDIFPAGDVALQAAVGHAFGYENRPNANELRVLAEQWVPWRGVAARLFWAYYAVMKGRSAFPVQ